MEMGKKLVVLLAVVVMMMGIESSRALSLCKMSDAGLEACKPYVTQDAPNTAAPSAQCCKALAGADLQCLCGYKGSPMLKAFGIDPDLALALPAKCNPPIAVPCS
ncbi:putative lipid-transfer protein DIR1 [Citrus sinensis]|uniref:Lipid-transfer protein DIR1 n=1 Tax=Citrus sinensis TaxID=2711 RepID=A0ACB8N957_CITSI|nr:putative lipid-transfer protein DIR1 [Citrus sinensis]